MSEPAGAAVKSGLDVIWQTNLVEQVRDKLLGAIVNGELQPGERLVEAELARRLGVSRGPIREAARLLEQRGFLRSEPRRGFFVRTFSLDDIDALFELRSCVQAFAARKAASQATSDNIQKLRDLYEDIRVAGAEKGNPLASMEANFAFHRFLCELSGNPRIVEVFDSLIWETRQIATLANLAEETPGEFFIEHDRPILDAFETGDAESLGDAVARYLEVSRDSVKEFYLKSKEETKNA